jgi:hypothetical protein
MPRKPTESALAKRAAKKAINERNPIQTGVGGTGLVPEARPIAPPPPPSQRGPGNPVVVSVEAQRSWYMSASLMLPSSSIAYQLDPAYQQMMLRDPDVAASLQALVLEIASLEGSWEAEDEDDAKQVAFAETMNDIYQRIPRRTDMIRNLALASWYGNAAVNFQIVRDPETQFAVSGWVPIHPDALAYDLYGNVAMRVGAKYLTELSVIDIGLNSMVHIFTREERANIILNRNFTEAPSFDDPRSADQVYRGVGNRDRIWFLWYLKQKAMQQCSIFMERYSAGVRIGRYTAGNDAEQTAIINALANMLNDNTIALPRTPGQDIDSCDIEILDPPAARATVFMDFINWCSSKIKEVQQGQSLTSEAGGTGMGSGVSEQHANTKSLFVRFLADTLAESVTTDFGGTFGRLLGYSENTIRRVKLKLATERPNIKERLEAAKLFYDMGGGLDENELRAMIGFSEPSESATVLRGGMGMNPLDGLFGADPGSEIPKGKQRAA